MSKNSNPYLRLLKKNEAKLDSIKNMHNRAKQISKLFEKDLLPAKASEKLKSVRKAEIDHLSNLWKKHEEFVKSEKTQATIDSMLADFKNFIKPYEKLGL